MLKSKINKSQFDALDDLLKAEYKANGSDYLLDTDDATELRNAHTLSKQEVTNLKQQLTDVTKEFNDMKKAGGDFSTLEQSYKDKIGKLEKKLEETNTVLTGERNERILGTKAEQLAKENFTVPSLVKKELLARMELDPRDNTTIKFKDKDGKPSAMTEADLLKEFVDNAEFKTIVIANRSSGGAGNGTNAGGAGNPPIPPLNNDGKPVILGALSPQQLAAHMATKAASA